MAPTPALLTTTAQGRKVYGWWALPSGRSLDSWLSCIDGVNSADDLDTLNKVGDKGTFLITHQRDWGVVYWYPEGVYDETHEGAWMDGGIKVKSFST